MVGPDSQPRWEPFEELRREVGRIFEGFEPWLAWPRARPFPAINLYEVADRFILVAELPGVATEGLDLSITGQTVLLRGERARPEGVAEECYRRQERPFGRWARSVSLPSRVDGSRATADLADGLLTVTLPKAQESRATPIAVVSRPES